MFIPQPSRVHCTEEAGDGDVEGNSEFRWGRRLAMPTEKVKNGTATDCFVRFSPMLVKIYNKVSEFSNTPACS